MDAQTQVARTPLRGLRGRPRRRLTGACQALPQIGRLVFMFTDIEGSAEMHERLGDFDCLRILRSHNHIVCEQVARHGGIVVKAQGDGFMLAFQEADAALRCATEIQTAISSAGVPVRVRIGLHSGQGLREGNDYFGRDVILASRVTSQACGGEILVSASLAGEARSARFDEGREVTMKGFDEAVRVHRLVYAE